MNLMEKVWSALSGLSALPALMLPYLPIPPWAAGLVTFLLLLLLAATAWLIGFRRLFRYSFSYGLFFALLIGGYFGFRQYDSINQRRLLEDRANALFSQTIQPGSVFACIDGSPSPAMRDACERTLFAEPQLVAQSVAITTQRVAYLIEALRYASTRDRNYFSRVAPLRQTMQSDPYGFTGFVLVSVYQCMPDLCDKFSLFDDPERVKENIRSRRYEAYMAKYAGVWRGEPLPEVKKDSGIILPGVAIGDTPKNLTPLDAGPPALFDPVPRGNPMPSGPVLPSPTTPPAAATPPAVTPPPTLGQRRSGNAVSATPVAAPARALSPAEEPVARPAVLDPEESKSQKKSAPKGEAAKGEEKEKPGAQKKSSSAKGEPKGSVYQRRGSEPVAGLPRLVPGDYRRPDPNEPPETPTPSGVIMSPNP